MDLPIVTRATHYARGVEAARRKELRDSHNMNPWAPALADWLAGFDSVTAPLEQLEGCEP